MAPCSANLFLFKEWGHRALGKRTTHAIGRRRMPRQVLPAPAKVSMLPYHRGSRSQSQSESESLSQTPDLLAPPQGPRRCLFFSLILSLTAINANKFYSRKCALACPFLFVFSFGPFSVPPSHSSALFLLANVFLLTFCLSLEYVTSAVCLRHLQRGTRDLLIVRSLNPRCLRDLAALRL